MQAMQLILLSRLAEQYGAPIESSKVPGDLPKEGVLRLLPLQDAFGAYLMQHMPSVHMLHHDSCPPAINALVH